MRKIIVIFLSVFIVVGSGAFGINWFLQASQTKKQIEQIIANINQGKPYLTYESITTSGFPMQVIVSIVKPHFSGRIDELLKSLPQNANNPQAFATMPEWQEDVLLNGAISFSVNALSDHYIMTVSGEWQESGHAGSQTLAMTTQSSGSSVCVLDLAHEGGLFSKLWNFRSLRNNLPALAHDFRQLDCSNPAYHMIDSKTQAVLGSSGGSRLYITNHPDGTSEMLRLYVKLTDVEMTEAGHAAITTYMQAAFPDSFASPYVAGKQNAEIDFSYGGPSQFDNNIKTSPFEIHLSKFSISGPFYTWNSTWDITNEMSGNNRTAKLLSKSSASFNEQYDTLMQDLVHHFVQQCYATQTDPRCQMLQPVFQKYTAEDFYQMASPVIPNLHSLGTVSKSIDLSYQGSADFRAGDFNLADFELTAAPYGIGGKGSVKTVAGQLFPTANMTFTCSNCLRLVDDVMGYTARVQKLMAVFHPEQPAPTPISPERVANIKQFLSALSAPATADGTLSFAIISDGMNVSISGKRMDEVLTLYNQLLGNAPPPH